MNSFDKELRLLPGYFKIISLFLIILSIAAVVLSKFEIIFTDSGFIKQISMNTIMLSLLLLTISRDKEEDELTMKLRLKAFASTFIFGVVIVIIDPYINLLFDGSFILQKEVNTLLITMMIYYFIIFHLMKSRR